MDARLTLACASIVGTLLLACGGDDEASPIPSATLSPASTLAVVMPTNTIAPEPIPTATPELIGPDLPVLSYLYDAEFPPNTMLVVLPGCSACDSPPDYLYRVYRNGGEVHADQIFTAPSEFSEPGQPYIMGFTASIGLKEIAAAVCTEGYCGAVAPADPDHAITFYASDDAGATWTERDVVRPQRDHWLIGRAAGGALLMPINPIDVHAIRYSNGAPVSGLAARGGAAELPEQRRGTLHRRLKCDACQRQPRCRPPVVV